jgi:hypothetical protein
MALCIICRMQVCIISGIGPGILPWGDIIG